jgi:hypothetical protein
LVGGNVNGGTVLSRIDKDAKEVEKQVNERSNKPGFHGGVMIS